ncbi:hypothetical protein COO60DRAFT_709416 [Scenedesmus sp. NREL 46B-D3]|nr:hypothetical protein COO60DRAFT_709416 [Scenedesmus sp. NREL 46B-D3]
MTLLSSLLATHIIHCSSCTHHCTTTTLLLSAMILWQRLEHLCDSSRKQRNTQPRLSQRAFYYCANSWNGDRTPLPLAPVLTKRHAHLQEADDSPPHSSGRTGTQSSPEAVPQQQQPSHAQQLAVHCAASNLQRLACFHTYVAADAHKTSPQLSKQHQGCCVTQRQ